MLVSIFNRLWSYVWGVFKRDWGIILICLGLMHLINYFNPLTFGSHMGIALVVLFILGYLRDKYWY